MDNRRRDNTRSRSSLIAVALAAVLGACGGNGGDAGTPTTEMTATTGAMANATTEATIVETTGTTASTTTETAGVIVEVYFSTGDGSDCSVVEAFPRRIPDDLDPIEAALEQLAAGPTADETAAGAGSFFSAATADVVSLVNLSDGLLQVDFVDLRSLLPNASTSCGSESFLATLNSTVFQFPEVERVRYRIEGSCDAFANWLQRECFEVSRTGEQLDIPVNERAAGAGCTAPDDTLRDGRWFGFIPDAQADQVSFDLACWFTGTAAAAAASEDGEESPPPNDYHIRNTSDRLRAVAVDPSAEVAWYPDPGNPASLTVVPYAVWQAEQPLRSYRPGVWLNVEDGRIASIEEQYVP